MEISAWDGAKIGLAVTAVGVVAFVGYKVYKGIGGMVSNIGTGKNVTGAASTVWSARPKVIFKGIDADLDIIIGGLEQ